MVAITEFRPNSPESNDPKEKYSLKTKIIASLGAAAVVASAAFGISKIGGQEKGIPMDNDGNDRVATAPAVPGETGSASDQLEQMSPDQFAELSAADRLDYVYDHFDMDKERTDTYAEMMSNNMLSPAQAEAMASGMPTGDKAQWSAAEIIRDLAVRQWAATSFEEGFLSTMSEKERTTALNEHLKMFSTVVDPQHPKYERMEGNIGFGEKPLAGISNVVIEYPKIDSGSIPYGDDSGRMHDLDGKLTAFIYTSDAQTGDTGLGMIQLVETPNGHEDWMYIDRYLSEDKKMMINGYFAKGVEAPGDHSK